MSIRSSNKYMLFLVIYQLVLSLALSVVFLYFGVDFSMPLFIAATQIVIFIVPFCLYLLLTKKKLSDVLSLKKISLINLAFIFLIILLFQPLMYFFSALAMLFFDNNVSAVMTDLYAYPLWLVFIVIAVVPSICEEITMRGVIFSGYKNIPVIKGALINGLFFGIMHLDAQQFLYAFVLGVVFYYLVYYTNSILAPMFAHFVINGTQSLMAYISLSLVESQGTEIAELPEIIRNIDEKVLALISTGVLAVLTAPFAFAALYLFIYYNKKKSNQYIVPNEAVSVPYKIFDVFSISLIIIYVIYIIFSIIAARL